MARILKGAEVVSALHAQLTPQVEALKAKGVLPTLAIVRVGARQDDVAYEKGATKRAETLGVAVRTFLLDEGATQAELLATIQAINADDAIHGVLLFRPLPKRMDDESVRAALLPEKDIDGITDGSLAGVFTGTRRGFPPCTAQACMEILNYYRIPVSGRNAVVIGRSLVVGKPVAMMLLQQNATVTVCHTKTQDMPSVTKQADILIVAAGRAGVVGADYVSAGQTVIDVGINFTPEGAMVGDADFAAIEPIVGAITPVPGGVGTVTTTVLIAHVIEAAQRSIKRG
ncbi:MAG: bifunctional 5,10-methylene-tetrahydrofolate dehydrogenase/5,10-methylene-tetrahydrofolate cyclohydrolase [Eubacteriales bacterium]|nr:bifunctional 5,10-methylene-tetrahydrofolate dehydrogenase/5,10-methylene-tetrahydrofolate cyclohydrolase [Eubacteriales bacterium]